jgi:hypothetical protein
MFDKYLSDEDAIRGLLLLGYSREQAFLKLEEGKKKQEEDLEAYAYRYWERGNINA